MTSSGTAEANRRTADKVKIPPTPTPELEGGGGEEGEDPGRMENQTLLLEHRKLEILSNF